MKKTTLFILLLFLMTISLSAQFVNTTFYAPNQDVQGKRVTVISGIPVCYNGSTNCDEIVFSNTVSIPAEPDKFMLVRTEDWGSFINAVVANHELNDHDIISTADHGILVAGHPNKGNPDGTAFLAVMKYDNSLNLQWSKQIPLIYRPEFPGKENIAIEKVLYEGEEHYYIACTGGNPDPLLYSEGVISAVRIDQNGNLIWHKTYTDPNRHDKAPWGFPLSGRIAFQNDGVNDITAYPDGGQLLFCIAGTRFEYLDFYGSPLTDNLTFYMSIDENGNIVHDFRFHLTNHYAYTPDMVWDGNFLVTVYEQQNTFPPPPDTPAFIMGLTRLNPDLSLHDYDYYSPAPWLPLSIRPQSISLNSSGNYIVSCWEDLNPIGRTSGFCEISSSLPPMTISPRQSNQLQDQVYISQKHVTDANDRHYMVPTVNKSLSGITNNRPRLIRSGNAITDLCGRTDYDLFPSPGYGIFIIELYADHPTEGISDYLFESWEMDLTQDYCEQAPDPWLYRLSNTDKKDVQINPTLLRNSTENVKCTIHSIDQGNAEIIVLNAVGQVIYHKRVATTTGENIFSIDTQFAVGINIIKVIVNKVVTTKKIVVTG